MDIDNKKVAELVQQYTDIGVQSDIAETEYWAIRKRFEELRTAQKFKKSELEKYFKDATGVPIGEFRL